MKSHLQELTTLWETQSIVTILQLRIWGKFITNLFDLTRITITTVKAKYTIHNFGNSWQYDAVMLAMTNILDGSVLEKSLQSKL